MKIVFSLVLALFINSLAVVNASTIATDGKEFETGAIGQTSPRYYMSWDEVTNLTQRVADHLNALPEKPTGMLIVSRGGLVPGGILAQKLGIKNIRVICLESYGEDETRGTIRSIYAPNDIIFDGEKWVVVDDLVDMGLTLGHIRERYSTAHYVTLAAKPAGKSCVDFSAKDFSQDTWIVFPWENK
ncbi:MAG: xanthine phosphoribosyltransferase [Alphaproteobacteria bacterium]|jgi:xanthine phosphoribosyltransferase|nr:xanthine phosphoribosyltransferase [Alphaproteobacteria bacterium]